MCILAGYAEPMKKLMAMDPGLPRRFPKTLELPNYTPLELARITRTTAQQSGFNIDGGALRRLPAQIAQRYASQIASHNGGLAVQLTEAAVGRLLERVVDEDMAVDDIASHILTCEDFGISTSLPCMEPHLFVVESSELSDSQLTIQPAVEAADPEVELLIKAAQKKHSSVKQAGILPPMPNMKVPDVKAPEFNWDNKSDSPQETGAEAEKPQINEQNQEQELSDDELYLEAEHTQTAGKKKPDEKKDAQRKERVIKSGACPQNYGWNRRKPMSNPCLKCGQTRADGFQCEAGSHWMCMKCIDDMDLYDFN